MATPCGEGGDALLPAAVHELRRPQRDRRRAPRHCQGAQGGTSTGEIIQTSVLDPDPLNFNFFLCHQTSQILGSILHIIFNF